MTDTPTTPAGWYDDGSGRRRYWDGAAWTDHYETPAAPAAPEVAPAPVDTAATPPAYGAPATGYSAPADPSAPPAYGAPTTPAAQPPAYGAPTTPYGSQQPTTPYGASQPTTPYGSQPGYAPTAYGAPVQTYAPPAGYGTPPARVRTAADSKPSVVGLIALGVAVLGLILAFVPFVQFVSWILLPIALVLAIVAFFLRGRKWPAIAALIVAVVGGIAAVVIGIIYAVLAAQALVSNIPNVGSGPATVAPPANGGSSGNGSQSDPAAIGSTISSDEYTVVINSVTLDADDAVLAASSINEPAPAGQSYAVVNETITYTGTDTGFALFVLVGFIGDDGTDYSNGSYAVAPDPAIGLDELQPGQTTTGNVVILVPDDGKGLVQVTPGILADNAYVKLP